jgi:hypothetical protein
MPSILIVDDEKSVRATLARFLQNAGYAVETAEDATQAEELLKKRSFDVVVTDIILPGISGVELLRNIKRQAPDALVLMMTGEPTAETAVEAVRAGAYDYLIKPVSKEVILRVVARAVQVKGLQDERRRLEAANREYQAGLERLVEERTRSLRESEALYQSLVENLPQNIFRKDLAGRFTFANQRFCQLLGKPLEQILGKTDFDFYPTALAQKHQQDDRRVCETREPLDEVEEHRRPEGEGLYVQVVKTPVQDAEGHIVGVQGVLWDITTRKRAEERIREQARLLDLAHDAIVVRDLMHRIQFWNQGCERLLGWTAAEVLGKNALEVIGYHDPRAFDAAMRTVLDTGEWIGELQVTTKDGRAITVMSHWSLVPDAVGKPGSILVIDTDITDKKQLEARFLRTQRMEAIGTLAAGIAHDLNNILSPILLSAPMLRDQALSGAEFQKMATIIETSAQRASEVIKQVLTFGRGTEGQQIAVQVRHIINDVVKMARETFPRSLTIASTVARDLWVIAGDPTQIQQVLLNLCINARDAMPDGGQLRIQARNLVLDEQTAQSVTWGRPGPFIVVGVQDTGCGIPPENLERIFDPFFTTKPAGKGTGLGLSTALGIVRSHSGFLGVHSEVGGGSLFEVYLPAAPGRRETQMQPKLAAPPGKGQLILLVDDEACVRETSAQLLIQWGYEVLTASDGMTALGLYAQHRDRIKGVVTDLMMPDMDGPSLIRALRRLDPDLPIMAATGLASPTDPERTMMELQELGVYRVLHKPFEFQELLTALYELLNPPPLPEPGI